MAMVKRFNPATGQLEMVDDEADEAARAAGDGMPLNPTTGPKLYPDVVGSENLETAPVPRGVGLSDRRPLLGSTETIQTTPGAGSSLPASGKDMIPIGDASSMSPAEREAGTPEGDKLIAAADQLDANAKSYQASLPQSQAPAAPARPVGPPPMVVTGASSTTQTSEKQMRPEEALAQGRLETDAEEEASLAGQRADKEKELASKNLQITQQANKDIAAAQAETDRQVAAQEKAISQLENIVAAKRAQLEARPLQSFFVGKRPAAEFVAAISGAVGAYVAVRSGSGRNFAKESIDKAIDRDFKEQEFRIANDKELLALAKQDVQAAQLKKTAMLHELQIKKVGLLDVAERMRAEELASHGVKVADIAKDEKILAIRKKRHEESAELWKGLRRDVTRSSTVQRQPLLPAAAGGVNENSIMGPDGKTLGIAPDKKVAQEASAGIAGYTNFTRAAKQYLDMIDKHGSELAGKGRGDLEALQAELLFAVRDSNTGLGSLDKGLQDVVEKLIPDATGLSGTFTSKANMVAKLSRAMKLADGKLQTRLASAGVGNPAIAADIRKRAMMSAGSQ